MPEAPPPDVVTVVDPVAVMRAPLTAARPIAFAPRVVNVLLPPRLTSEPGPAVRAFPRDVVTETEASAPPMTAHTYQRL